MSCSSKYQCPTQPLSPTDFINNYVEFARYASYQLKWPVALILAQWSIESNWGLVDICDPCNNPANTGRPTGNCPCTQYSDLCDGVSIGYISFAQNNYDHSGSGKTYANLVADAFSSGSFTIPNSNNYGCLPGAGTNVIGDLKPACAALGSSGWAQTDYLYCSAGTGPSCCNNSNWAGQTLYERAINYFADYDYIDTTTTYPSCC